MTDDSRKQEADASAGKQVRVRWPLPGNAVYANNIVVQRDEAVFYISFFQVNPPIILTDSAEERKKELESIDALDAIPIARVALPHEQVMKLIQILGEQLIKADKTRQ